MSDKKPSRGCGGCLVIIVAVFLLGGLVRCTGAMDKNDPNSFRNSTDKWIEDGKKKNDDMLKRGDEKMEQLKKALDAY